MLYGKNENCRALDIIPKQRMNDGGLTANEVTSIIKDQLMDEGQARKNLATFCQTYMESEATELLSKTFEKNSIDKSEYPNTAEIENACVNMIAHLWHAPSSENYIGTSTVGSSEACMLAGMAMKFRWRNNAEKENRTTQGVKPNLVISAAYQVCWEKFCVYWDVEMRTVPVDKNNLFLNTDIVMDYVDENTIGIVGILGITYTGMYDNIATLDQLVEDYNKTHGHQLVIHVDGASGGLYTPFIEPELKWDFRLKNVVSISTSGHKYGLVYPGVGWVIWRDKEYLPKELVFEVSYLGGTMPTMAINFSRSASQIIGQYYNFLRHGRKGYEEIHRKTRERALHISKSIEETGEFDLLHKGYDLPVICYSLKERKDRVWNLYDLADRLMMKGWQVPAYPLPNNMTSVIVQRIVCRADFSTAMVNDFVDDLHVAVDELNKANATMHQGQETVYGFTH